MDPEYILTIVPFNIGGSTTCISFQQLYYTIMGNIIAITENSINLFVDVIENGQMRLDSHALRPTSAQHASWHCSWLFSV